jgi:hypothetical protein
VVWRLRQQSDACRVNVKASELANTSTNTTTGTIDVIRQGNIMQSTLVNNEAMGGSMWSGNPTRKGMATNFSFLQVPQPGNTHSITSASTPSATGSSSRQSNTSSDDAQELVSNPESDTDNRCGIGKSSNVFRLQDTMPTAADLARSAFGSPSSCGSDESSSEDET